MPHNKTGDIDSSTQRPQHIPLHFQQEATVATEPADGHRCRGPQCGGACRKKQKENQEDLLQKANQETMRALKSTDGAAAVTAGRKVSAVEAYRRVEDIPSSRELAIMVRIYPQTFPHRLSGTGCLSPVQSALMDTLHFLYCKNSPEHPIYSAWSLLVWMTLASALHRWIRRTRASWCPSMA